MPVTCNVQENGVNEGDIQDPTLRLLSYIRLGEGIYGNGDMGAEIVIRYLPRIDPVQGTYIEQENTSE